MTPSELIKAARKQAGLTQEQLAELLKVAQGRVSEWERGKREPSASALLKILQITDHKL